MPISPRPAIVHDEPPAAAAATAAAAGWAAPDLVKTPPLLPRASSYSSSSPSFRLRSRPPPWRDDAGAATLTDDPNRGSLAGCLDVSSAGANGDDSGGGKAPAFAVASANTICTTLPRRASSRWPDGSRLKRTYASVSAVARKWGAAVAVGVLVGLLAAVLDICAEWLSDMRFGYCVSAWYLSRQKCCYVPPADNDTSKLVAGLQDKCVTWHTWSYSILSIETFPPVNFGVYLLSAVGYATASAFLIKKLAPEYGALSGIPELKTLLGGFMMQTYLSFRTFAVKLIALMLSVSSGLSIGNKAPLVHLAACIGSLVSKISPEHANDETARVHLLSCASAAGISVGFGSPIGGILYALEEVSSFFPPNVMLMSFLCSLAATITLELMNPYGTGTTVMFKVPQYHTWNTFELLSFTLIGALGGAVGALLCQWNIKIQIARKTSLWCQRHPIREVGILAFLTATFGYWSSLSRDKMISLLAHLFKECDVEDYYGVCESWFMVFTFFSLLFAAVFRFVAVIVTYGTRIPAGLYLPCMVVGACLGRLVAIIIQFWQGFFWDFSQFTNCGKGSVGEENCVHPGSYALLGAAAVLTGATRLTISIVVILFELTGTMEYVLPSILAVVVAKFVADAMIGRLGHSGLMIQINNYPFLDNREDALFKSTVWQVLRSGRSRPPLAVISGLTTVAELRRSLACHPYALFPVVSCIETMGIEGSITRVNLISALSLETPYAAYDRQTVTFLSRLQDSQPVSRLKSKPNNLGGLTRIPTPVVPVPESPAPPSIRSPGQGSTLSATKSAVQQQSPTSHVQVDGENSRESRAEGQQLMKPAIVTADLDFSGYVDSTPLAVHPATNMGTVHAMFVRLGLRYVLVKSRGRVLDVVTRKDVIRSYDATHQTFVAAIGREQTAPLDLDPVIARGLRMSFELGTRFLRWTLRKVRGPAGSASGSSSDGH